MVDFSLFNDIFEAMAGERGPVDISQVEIGKGLRLVRKTGFQYEPSGITGTVIARSEGEVTVRLTGPRSLTQGAHLRMIVREGSLKVFNLRKQACSDQRPDAYRRDIPGSSGHVLPPGIF